MTSSDNSGKIVKSIRPSRIIFPILIGIGISGYMLYNEYTPGSFDAVKLTYSTFIWLAVSLLLMAIRDFGYIIRIRLLSHNQLTLRKAFSIVMLWEFTSAITPSAIGGTSVAIFFLNKEGIKIGRSTAIVMVTSFLDELYFIIAFPIVLLIIGRSDIFGFGVEGLDKIPWYKNQFLVFALAGYGLKFLYTLILTYGLFINPRGLKFLLLWIFKLPIIRKWRPEANESGTDLITASREFRDWSFVNWVQAFFATALSWTSRYWVVNTIIISFFGFQFLSYDDNLLVFGKQLVMWIMMLVSPTPGGSGFAEYVFKEFLNGVVPAGTGVTLAFIWRLLSYYPYLFIGILIVPRWIRKHFIKR
ncbi:lysylphosphatidylglycerol synthase transmembrane domain-containing protein [Plebeiibacterium sediminum]|uniref:Flippase-like domain-containing protein n=1 Tax=Plebeiibacterium sediminum TaxID=2992112 RepID=A0AAE3M228_9BACT|nr:lysylphosphatidylglycerol synthase transmembrane domain-containing protein [Plebeiobacterium sediminum]MCW3785526.1 flippase-like domain-containing protein [Plebeiobacterium sediminum]